MVTASELPVTKPIPTIVTAVPPAVVPESGVMLVNVNGVTYVYEIMSVPLGVVTVTVTSPAEPEGAVMLIVVAVSALMVARLGPKDTEVAPTRFVPVILTNVPAVVGPDDGEMRVIIGGVTYVYAPEVFTKPPLPLVILTQVAPAVPAGITAVIDVEDP